MTATDERGAPQFLERIEGFTGRGAAQSTSFAGLLMDPTSGNGRGIGARALSRLLALPVDNSSPTWWQALIVEPRTALPESERATLLLLAVLRLLEGDASARVRREHDMPHLITLLTEIATRPGIAGLLAEAGLVLALGTGDPNTPAWARLVVDGLAAGGFASAGPAALAIDGLGVAPESLRQDEAVRSLFAAVASASLNVPAQQDRSRLPIALAATVGAVPTRRQGTGGTRTEPMPVTALNALANWAAHDAADPFLSLNVASVLLATQPSAESSRMVEARLSQPISRALFCHVEDAALEGAVAARQLFLQAGGELAAQLRQVVLDGEGSEFGPADEHGLRRLERFASGARREAWAAATVQRSAGHRLVARIESGEEGSAPDFVAAPRSACAIPAVRFAGSRPLEPRTVDEAWVVFGRRTALQRLAVVEQRIRPLELGRGDALAGMPSVGPGVYAIDTNDEHFRSRSGGWVQLPAQPQRIYVIATDELPQKVDTELTLVAPDRNRPSAGRRLASDDDSGGGMASRLTWPSVAEGTLVLNIRNIGEREDVRGQVILSIEERPRPAPTPLTLGATSEFAFPAERFVEATLTVTSRGRYRLTTAELTDDVDTELSLWDGGMMLAENDDGPDGTLASRLHHLLDPGEYLVRVKNLRSGVGPEARFRLMAVQEN
jgi:hypothetical protein